MLQRLGVLKTALRFNAFLVGLEELNNMVILVVYFFFFFTAKGHRLKSAVGRGTWVRAQERLSVGLPGVLSQGSPTDSISFSQPRYALTLMGYCQSVCSEPWCPVIFLGFSPIDLVEACVVDLSFQLFRSQADNHVAQDLPTQDLCKSY